MPTIENPHVRRLYESIERHADAETAREIALRVPLSRTATEKKKAQWAGDILRGLRERFDEETARAIRQGCACGPSPAHMENMRKLRRKAGSLAEFAETADRENQAFSMWLQDGALYLSYPVCYCQVVKRARVADAALWCACTVGYAKKMFDYALETPVEVELLESVKMGDDRCVMRMII